VPIGDVKRADVLAWMNEMAATGMSASLLRHSVGTLQRILRFAVKRAGLPDGVRYHDLRHTYASLLIAEGARPRAIMERLGHSSIQVTLGTYGHLFPTLDEALTSRLDKAIQSERGNRSGARVAQHREPKRSGE
jgi:integrase